MREPGEGGVLAAWASDMPERRRDDFRMARWRPLLVAILLVLIGVASLAIVPDDVRRFSEDFWLAIAAYFILAMAIGAFWLAWRRPAILRVGPDGVHVTPGYAGPFPWSDIRELRYRRVQLGLANVKSVLEIELAPDAEIPVRSKTRWLAAVDRWYARKVPLRAPLWMLAEPEEDVLASVERFRAVEREAR